MRNKLKQIMKEKKEQLLQKKLLSSKNSRSNWKIIPRILKPTKTMLIGKFNKLNEFYNNIAKPVTNKISHNIK